MGDWFKAGVAGVGLGSKLITKEVLANKNFEQLEAQTKELLALVKTIR
jgi:2-dehydro-3-deoxyphosphogluconate aldolase/(4S)-4-hydroxy-2-oxoglutarate aldolase